jgi:hypothetical protein
LAVQKNSLIFLNIARASLDVKVPVFHDLLEPDESQANCLPKSSEDRRITPSAGVLEAWKFVHLSRRASDIDG